MGFCSDLRLGRIAERIRVAYRCRVRSTVSLLDTGWNLWEAAAETLIAAHQLDRDCPIDPELFVASQEPWIERVDPWTALISPQAIHRYRLQIHGIVRILRRELRVELAWCRRRRTKGLSLDAILERPTERMSALGRYIAACREGRDDLASRYLKAAMIQHEGCPLYRLAAATLIPPAVYPAHDPNDPLSWVPSTHPLVVNADWN